MYKDISKVWLIFLVYFAAIFVGSFSANAEEVKPVDKVKVDKILIVKHERKLSLLEKGKIVKEYSVSLGRKPIGAKEQAGDMRTPEGTYRIDYKNPKSEFHFSLHISYPNKEDRKRAEMLGVDPGGDIMIHGLRKEYEWAGRWHLLYDWTEGCIAVTSQEIDEIAELVEVGTIVEIQP